MKKPTREILKDTCEKAHSIFESQQHEAEATINSFMTEAYMI